MRKKNNSFNKNKILTRHFLFCYSDLMHEMSYVVGFIDMALKELEMHPGAIPEKLVVEVGQMTGVLPEYLQKYFPLAAKETLLCNASLEVISIPVEAKCASCALIYHPDKEYGYRCPACGESAAALIHGRECNLKQIVIKE